MEVEHLLSTTRLLTLVGSGGVGKTRLAQRVASRVLERYPDGAWLVELAGVVDAALLPYAAAMSLGLGEAPGRPPLSLLTDHLQPRHLLLVLDNCEHLVVSSAELIDVLLRTCPALHILATSREPLGVSGELAWRVPSLSLPCGPLRRPGSPDVQSEAVSLFLERAREAAPTFAATEQNSPAIARVCFRLDGIPLALELAATRVTQLTVEQIADELDDRFRLLVGGSRTAVPRQQTLQATFDWSFDLLSDPERAVLRRLAPFAGGFGLDAARAVCCGSDVAAQDVLDLLMRLVNKSLVLAEVLAVAARFRLLETVQQYAAARLLEAGETLATGARHLGWFLELAERAEPEQRGAHQTLWLDRLEMEHENISAALEWSWTHADNAEAGLRLAASLRWFWLGRGHPSEGLLWLKRGLAAANAIAPPVRAKALDAARVLCHSLGDLVREEGYLTDALALAREMNDSPRIATLLNNLAALAIDQGDYDAAQLFLRESLSLFQELGDRSGIAVCLEGLAEAAVAGSLCAAVVLLAAASTWREANDCPVPPYDRADYERVLRTARWGVKSAAFGAAWTAGAAMTLEQAIEQAPPIVREGNPGGVRVAVNSGLILLTPREREVARLVSRGLTNREIAEELGIAAATATLHVEHVRGKLGFRSRAQVAVWIAQGMPAST